MLRLQNKKLVKITQELAILKLQIEKQNIIMKGKTK